MKKLIICVIALSVAGLRANSVAAQETPVSEAFKAIKEGLVVKKGDPTELVAVNEVAVQKVESLAAQGKDVKDAVDYLESRINFDPRKKALNEQTIQAVRDRLNAALKRRADVVTGKVAPAA